MRGLLDATYEVIPLLVVVRVVTKTTLQPGVQCFSSLSLNESQRLEKSGLGVFHLIEVGLFACHCTGRNYR